MRFLIVMVLFLAAAGVVDNFYFGGRYRHAAVQEANHESKQIRAQINSLVSKVVGR